jgi:CDGSH-type Zn-finger protein
MPSHRQILLTPYRDGPLIVRGPARIVDADGRELPTRRNPLALCRCGKSRLRPLCDGTHRLIGFRATGAPDSVDDGARELERLGLALAQE